MKIFFLPEEGTACGFAVSHLCRKHGFDGSNRLYGAKCQVWIICRTFLFDRCSSRHVIPGRIYDAVLLPQ